MELREEGPELGALFFAKEALEALLHRDEGPAGGLELGRGGLGQLEVLAAAIAAFPSNEQALSLEAADEAADGGSVEHEALGERSLGGGAAFVQEPEELELGPGAGRFLGQPSHEGAVDQAVNVGELFAQGNHRAHSVVACPTVDKYKPAMGSTPSPMPTTTPSHLPFVKATRPARRFFRSALGPAVGAVACLMGSTSLAFAQVPGVPAEEPSEEQPEPLGPPTRFEANVDDPMLAPAPRPERVVATWQEARDLLEQHSTDLGIALADVEAAEGRWRQALSSLLPNAFASAAVGYDLLSGRPSSPVGASAIALLPAETSPTIPLAGASLSLSQSLVDISAWSGLSSASALERRAEATLEDTRRRVLQGLAASAIAVVAAERAAELNRVGLRQALERQALTQRMLELGAATQLDKVRVDQDVEVARSAVIQGDEDLRATREAFGLALGIRDEVGVSPDFSLDQMREELVERCEELPSIEERGDVVAADEAANAARASRRQALYGYLPSLGFTTSTAALTTTPGPVQVPTWSVAAVLSVPLWEGGFREGLVKERAAAERRSEWLAEATRRGASIEEQRAIRLESSSAALVETANQSLALAEDVDRLTRRMFEIGRASSFDLVLSAQALRQAQLNQVLREYQHVRARLDAFLTVARCP